MDRENERRANLLNEYQETPEYKEKLITRLKIIDGCNRSKTAQIYAIAACKADPFFFFNNFCWTPNDKYEQYHFPFILYPFQEEYIEWLNKHIEGGKDGLVEKSREMGVTWLTMTLFLWRWLFTDNFNALIGSYKQELVDDRMKDSLFGMLDYQLNNIPKWMMPKRFKPKQHRMSMKLSNPENNNLIKGDTMNPEFGRGSRRTVTFMDEGAHWEYFQDAWDALADTSNCRITVSTPAGYNSFAALRDSGIDVKTLHWRSHPLKDAKWYEYEKSRRTDENVAQELDISYHKSQKGRVYPEWDLVSYGDYPYDPSAPLYVSWDFGFSDETALIWWQRDSETGKMKIVDCHWNNGKTIDFYIPFINGMVSSDGYTYGKRDLEVIEAHKNWVRGTHFGDPAGRFRNQVVNQSVIDALRNAGITVNFRDNWKQFEHRIQAAKMIMKDGLLVNKNRRTDYLNICMINSQYAEIQRGGISVINSQRLKPRHDAYCLAGDTEIRTLKGWKKIKELDSMKDFYVWSYSTKEHRLVPSIAKKCLKTGEKKELVEIGLDNGISLKCTPEHLLMMRDETWKMASQLKKGDSVMPFYERNMGGYIGIDLNDGSFVTEHAFVFNRIIGSHRSDDAHIDHIDGDVTNNEPSNLQELTPQEHCGKTFRGKSMKQRREMGRVKFRKIDDRYFRKNIIRDCPFCGKEFIGDYKTFYCSRKCNIDGWNKRNNHAKRVAEGRKNHGIRFVKHGGTEDVYDISVPEYNNFVANGVVVHNSHLRSSFEYGALGLQETSHRRVKVYDKFPIRSYAGKEISY